MAFLPFRDFNALSYRRESRNKQTERKMQNSFQPFFCVDFNSSPILPDLHYTPMTYPSSIKSKSTYKGWC